MGQAAMLIAGGLSAAGSLQQGQAQAQAARANIRITQQQQAQAEANARQQATRTRSRNITLIAKSGVRRTGSPVEVLARNAALIEKQRIIDANNSQLQIEFLRGERDGALVGSGLSAGAQLLGAAGQAAGMRR